jgi:hypothetical protein
MQHLQMTPAAVKRMTSAGALRAAEALADDPIRAIPVAQLIDRETGLSALVDVLEEILAEAGDLIETRSPELVAQARAVLRYSGDSELRQAE